MTAPALTAHPYADAFPLLPDADLDELAESIRANGLRQPVVLDRQGRILDGRNRAAACALVGIEPATVVYDGDDLAEYVIDCNSTRRHMSTGARAMATAVVLAADGRRENGRWKRDSVAICESASSESGWAAQVARAGVVLDYTPDLAPAVVSGEMALSAAFMQADTLRQSADHDRIKARERKRREKEEAAAEAERDGQVKVLRHWTAEDFDTSTRMAYRKAAEVTASAREHDEAMTAAVRSMKARGADRFGVRPVESDAP